MQKYISLLALLLLLSFFRTAGAHANLERSEPAANALLISAPTEIRLWFSEPLEPKFSTLELRDNNWQPVAIVGIRVDATDAHQMVAALNGLPNGLYTVLWQTLSTADGHDSKGSFPFTVGPAINASAAAPAFIGPPLPAPEEVLPLAATLIRWFNFVGLALAVGSLGFITFVWEPVMQERWPAIEQRMSVIIWSGWLLAGLASLLLLLLQTSTATGSSLASTLTATDKLLTVATATRFGQLWLMRMSLWFALGGALQLVWTLRAFRWVALIIGALLLVPTSLNSHASAAADRLPALAGDWLHLFCMALWLGGLVQFAAIIRPVQRAIAPSTPRMSLLVSHFSNLARAAVIGLIISGFYAAWLQVGTLEALRTTLYGQALITKLILVIPLLAIAVINLRWTHQRLRAGDEVWVGRLRDLIGVEVILLAGVLVAAGAMAALPPARGVLGQRLQAQKIEEQARTAQQTAAVAANMATSNAIDLFTISEDMHITVKIRPGYVGENEFTIVLSDIANLPVTDAELIRLRFEHATEDLGQNELRITERDGNVYRIKGSNLSAPGPWKLRLTIQRPEKFDAVVDLDASVPAAPPTPIPTPVPAVAQSAAQGDQTSSELPPNVTTLLFFALLGLGIGGFGLALEQMRVWTGAGILSTGLVLFGGVCLLAAALAL